MNSCSAGNSASSANFSTAASASSGFTNFSKLIFVCCLTSCTLFTANEPADNDTPGNADSEDGQGNGDDDAGESASGSNSGHASGALSEALNLTTPAEATAWATRAFVSTASLPPNKALVSCAEQLKAIGAEAVGPEAELEAATTLQKAVGLDPRLYHYCFYNLMMHLDDRLAAGGAVYEELLPLFTANMRNLWILGKALDLRLETNEHYDYLEARYLQISHDIFGRTLGSVERAPEPKAAGGEPAH